MNELRLPTKNIGHLAENAKSEDDKINKIYDNLKMKCFEMPNAPYSNRQTV